MGGRSFAKQQNGDDCKSQTLQAGSTTKRRICSDHFPTNSCSADHEGSVVVGSLYCLPKGGYAPITFQRIPAQQIMKDRWWLGAFIVYQKEDMLRSLSNEFLLSRS